MTDQNMPAGLTREGARAVREWALNALNKPGASTTAEKAAARVILNTVPEPRPTLADMTPEERRACAWMQADVEGCGTRYVIVVPFDDEAETGMVSADGKITWAPSDRVTPRPDLRRFEWPDDKRLAPDLPGDWQVADHQKYGRVVVTKPNPNREGRVCYVLPADDDYVLGYDWHFCRPDELTYIDTTPEEE